MVHVRSFSALPCAETQCRKPIIDFGHQVTWDASDLAAFRFSPMSSFSQSPTPLCVALEGYGHAGKRFHAALIDATAGLTGTERADWLAIPGATS